MDLVFFRTIQIMLGLGGTDEELRQTMNSCFTGKEILLFQLLSMFALNLPLSIVSASHNSAWEGGVPEISV